MKKASFLSALICWALILFVFPGSFVNPAMAGASEIQKERAGEDLEAVKKEAKKVGQEATQSAKDLSARAGEEIKKAGKAIKKATEELKKSAHEAGQSLKELVKK